jgi:dephospho-CoA kinase
MTMAIIFITGMSGVGKSTLLAELARRGEDVVDSDSAGLVLEVHDASGQAIDHVWDRQKVTQLLDSVGAKNLFLAGCVSNQGMFYDRFSAVVLITVDRDVLLHRIASRTSNEYGKDGPERAAIIADLELVEPLLRATVTTELDGELPVTVLADRVQALASGVA